jgi:hypothetical protein
MITRNAAKVRENAQIPVARATGIVAVASQRMVTGPLAGDPAATVTGRGADRPGRG